MAINHFWHAAHLSDAFWSVTMYDLSTNLVDNPMDRYSIGDRTKGFKCNKEEGLAIFIQSGSPGADKE